jgi:hypothetical protein
MDQKVPDTTTSSTFEMLLALLLSSSASFSEEEQDELILTPPHLSDFVAARQVRNLTLSGKKELAPIYGRYFRKPLIQLLQSTQPHVLQLRSMYFQSFDGMVIKGEARGMAKFADIIVYDCSFVEGNQHAIHILGPSQNQRYAEDLGGERSSDTD